MKDPGIPSTIRAEKTNVVISTDLSAGIIAPLGGCQHCNPVLQYNDTKNFFINYRAQDTDDAMAVLMALNNPSVNVLSIVPLFGNTDLASEMWVTQYLVGHLKHRTDIPIVPGAISPPLPLLIQPPALYFNNTMRGGLRELDLIELFRCGCLNLGVEQMRSDLQHALAASTKVYVAVLGPTTDVACLLLNYPQLKAAIEAVVFLGSQPAGEPMALNGGPAPPDFNVYMDPLAAAVLLHSAAPSAAQPGFNLVLMHWTLTSLGTTLGQNIVLNRTTMQPPPCDTQTAEPWPSRTDDPAQQLEAVLGRVNGTQQLAGSGCDVPTSTQWLWEVQDVRTRVGFEGPNAVPPGPFDQYVMQYIFDPSPFACKALPVYMQQCPTAPWLANTSEPFNDADNPCPGHGPGSTARNMQQPAMMLVDLADQYSGPLVAGEGLLPNFGSAPAHKVTVCYDYASADGRQAFVDSLFKWTW